MKFGPVAIDEALGATLAHSTLVGSARFSKGRILSAVDINSLHDAGFSVVTVARFYENDVPENEAAEKIGKALGQPNIATKPATTGRVNLHADQRGLLRINVKKINSINRIDTSITVATLPDFSVCQAETMVATVKIIPFAAPKNAVTKAEKLAIEAFSLHPFAHLKVGMVQTTVPLLKDSVIEKTFDVTRQRIEAFGGTLDVAVVCNHVTFALAETLQSMLHLDVVIIFGASAVSDIDDIIPSAVSMIGGKITRVGMPVDPGNLLVLGKKGKTTIIGAPGCARSPKENGFDWVLARVFAGLKIRASDIIKMGVGGLLMEIPSRPSPRAKIENSSND